MEQHESGMSVIGIKTVDNRNQPESGTGMDKIVASTGLDRRLKIAIRAAAVILLSLLFWWFAPSEGSQTVAAERLTVSTVTRGTFDDFLPLRARVEPLVTVYLDAVEGGRVEKVMVED